MIKKLLKFNHQKQEAISQVRCRCLYNTIFKNYSIQIF